jgi:Fe-Mn family superoxide dismutase
MAYEAKKFNLPDLKGLSAKQVEVHLGLYTGYVKFLNTLEQVLEDLKKDAEKNAYALGEVHRRRGFEFDGMRMHEYYFSSMEEGTKAPATGSDLVSALSLQFGTFDTWVNEFKATGLMRGIGWAILYFDPVGKQFHNAWVSDHELGQLAGLPIILPMDMWEHAYMVDYTPSEKKTYIEAFFSNLNWQILEARYSSGS